MAQMYLASAALDGRSGHEVGRELLSKLFNAHVGTQIPTILTEPKGKPFFATGPWHFSISHTPRHAFCVLADVPVGLDAEEADRKIDLRLATKILSDREFLQYHASEDAYKALLSFWVLKEAQAKLTGEGLKWPPDHTDFTLPDSRIREIDGCLVAIIY